MSSSHKAPCDNNLSILFRGLRAWLSIKACLRFPRELAAIRNVVHRRRLRGARAQLRTLIVRRWVIGATVVLTGTVAGAWLLTNGQVWDAETSLAPSPQAVRAGMMERHDFTFKPVVTDDAIMEEAKRIYTEVQAPNNLQNAIIYLSNAPIVKAQLEAALKKPLSDSGEAPDYATIKYRVNAATAQMANDEITSASQGIPKDAWADFIYLDAKLSDSNVSKYFLKQGRIEVTVTELIADTDVTVVDPGEIRVSVRNRDPRVAEVLVDAVTAAYKATFDDRNRNAALATANFYTVEMQAAQRRLIQSQQSLSQFRRAHKDVFLPEQLTLAVRALDTTRREIESSRANLVDVDAQISAKNARLRAGGIARNAALEEQIATLSERRSGLVARLAELNSRAAQQSKVVESLPQTTTLSQMLNANAKKASERYEAVSKKLSAAQDQLAVVESSGQLLVRYWAGTGSSAERPEAPARLAAMKRNWVLFWSAILLSLFGSSAVVLGAAFFGSGRLDGEGGARVERSARENDF